MIPSPPNSAWGNSYEIAHQIVGNSRSYFMLRSLLHSPTMDWMIKVKVMTV